MVEHAWWVPEVFAARRANLEARMALTDAIRGFFRDHGFVEVETPVLQVSPGLEPHLIAFETELQEPFRDGPRQRLYLHTSPEFAMKKLLVAGVPRLYQMTKCFRNCERSATHHPEFTMLEWYRTGATYRDLMDDCLALLRACAAALSLTSFRRAGQSSDPFQEWTYLSVAAAFQRYAGIDLPATAPDPDHPDTERLRAEAQRLDIWTNPDDVWEDIFFRIFLEKIESQLGMPTPTVLYDYPSSMAALARQHPFDSGLAERFELFVCGLELANGYSELTEPAEQRRRFETDLAKKDALFGFHYPIDEELLAALSHGMPECAGIALGFDRLVMLATGAATIDDVLWAPVVAAD